MKLQAPAIGFGRGMTEAIVANGTQARGQNMTQVTGDKFGARQREDFPSIVAVAVLPPKDNMGVGEAEDARVGNGGAGDISAQVFEGGGAAAGRLDMHAPVLVPDIRINLPTLLVQKPSQMLAKGGLEVG
jgi:hypothetical protein